MRGERGAVYLERRELILVESFLKPLMEAKLGYFLGEVLNTESEPDWPSRMGTDEKPREPGTECSRSNEGRHA